MYRSLRVLFVVVLALAVAGSAAASVKATVSVDRVVPESNQVMVRFSLVNTEAETISVPAYETPLRGLDRELFLVLRDGEVIPYEGPLAFRVGPLEEDWVEIPAGSSVEGEINLAQYYDLSRPGNYTVIYRGLLHVYRGDPAIRPSVRLDGEGMIDDSEWRTSLKSAGPGGLEAVSLSSDPAAGRIEGIAPPEPPFDPEFEELFGTAKGFRGCSSTSTLTSAQSRAQSRAANAYYAASGYNSWYRTWFGRTSSYVSTVRGRFANSYWALDGNVNYYCGRYAPYCDSGTIAYTYQNRPGNIYICSLFWSQSSSMRAHAVSHESFHWNTVAGAEDYTYGSSNCRWLASNYPYYALANADNYAYAADTAR